MLYRLVMMRRRWRQRRYFRRHQIYVARGSFIAPGTRIGRRTRINTPSHLGRCEIGSYCAIGGRLVVRSVNHHTEFLNMQEWAQTEIIGGRSVTGLADGEVRIGHGVWLGDSVIVLPGVTIGNGAVIGAGAVVTRPIPPYAVAVGNPARVIRDRFPADVKERLERVEWWTWTDEELRARRELFELDLARTDVDTLNRLLPRDDDTSGPRARDTE